MEMKKAVAQPQHGREEMEMKSIALYRMEMNMGRRSCAGDID